MGKNWRYFKAVLRHKKFVFLAGRRRGVGLCRLLVHDWSKFLPSEWVPYAEWFEGYEGGGWAKIQQPDGLVKTSLCRGGLAHPESPLGQRILADRERRKRAFMQAFLLHLHRNPHHHQYWRLPSHGAKEGQVFPMPRECLLEMLADWDGAGMAYNGKEDTAAWYKQQSDIVLHADTRAEVERLLATP